MKKYKCHLALLYKAHGKLKDVLNAVLNHPLMPSEFERAWKNLIQRYNLQDDEVMNSLWDDRHEWISAYYKEIFSDDFHTEKREHEPHTEEKFCQGEA